MSKKGKPSEIAEMLWSLSLEKFATTTRADFRFAPLNTLLLVAFSVVGLIVHLSVYPVSVQAVALSLGSAMVLAVLIRICQVWEAVVVLGTANCLMIYLTLRPESHTENEQIIWAHIPKFPRNTTRPKDQKKFISFGKTNNF